MQHSTRESDQATGPGAAVVTCLGRVQVGAPLADGSLALLPLYRGERSKGPEYQTLAQAIASGAVVVTEAPQAQVPTLQVHNHSPLPILILDGEEVVGGRQNRVVNTSLLVPPLTTFDLPVTCVEHFRWGVTKSTFDPGEAVYPSLRRQKVEQVTTAFMTAAAPRSDQGAIWNEIDDRHQLLGSDSPTGAVRDAYVKRQRDLDKAEAALSFPAGDPVGIVALVSGRAFCADLFNRAETLREYWPRLVRSYALEALGSEPVSPSVASARRLLRRPLAAGLTAFASPGLGSDVRISGNGVVGAALVHEAAVLHLALFRHRQPRRADPPIRCPSQRARWYGA